MKTIVAFILSLNFLILNSCTDDDKPMQQPFVIGFTNSSISYSEIPDQRVVNLEFSKAAEYDGSLILEVKNTEATYNVDYKTNPEVQNETITLPFKKGDTSLTFDFINLIYPFDNSDKAIEFTVKELQYEGYNAIQGNKSLVISFNISIGATMAPEIGGPNQPYQVYIDLSTEKFNRVKRDTWDFGFYSGDDFRVALNGSIYMAAKKLNVYDIDAVTESQVSPFYDQVAIGTFTTDNEEYIDDPTGDITKTAIAEIQEDDAQNSVYLINLGYEPGTITPAIGSVAVSGNHRGWAKIRVLKRENDYLLQYAKVGESTHKEVTISKDNLYNFKFFSTLSNQEVQVEPEKTLWDLSFTVFTNVIAGSGSYGYSDFVVNNLKAGVKAYSIMTTNTNEYANFTLSMVDETKFMEDQRVIGSAWRDVFSGTAYGDRFYVLKDIDGNYYKIKMLGFLSTSGERGYPRFEYKLIQ